MKVARCSRPEFVITHWDITMCYLWFYIGLQVKLVSETQLKEINDISNSAASPDVCLLHGEPFIQNGHSRFSISLYAEGIVYMGNHAINISHPGCHAEEDGSVPDLLCRVTGRENPKGTSSSSLYPVDLTLRGSGVHSLYRRVGERFCFGSSPVSIQ